MGGFWIVARPDSFLQICGLSLERKATQKQTLLPFPSSAQFHTSFYCLLRNLQNILVMAIIKCLLVTLSTAFSRGIWQGPVTNTFDEFNLLRDKREHFDSEISWARGCFLRVLMTFSSLIFFFTYFLVTWKLLASGASTLTDDLFAIANTMNHHFLFIFSRPVMTIQK